MSIKETLIEDLQTKRARVGILGLGYVGLPLAVVFAEAGFHVTGIDTDARKVDCLNKGISYIPDVKTEAVEKLRAASLLWDKALSESNVKDSKARINEEITIAAMLNSSEANIHTEDYSKAETHLFKLESLDMSRKQKKKVEELNLLMKDQKKRTAANK